MSVTAILLLALNAAPAIRIALRLVGVGTQAAPAIIAGEKLVGGMLELLGILQAKELTPEELATVERVKAQAHARPTDFW